MMTSRISRSCPLLLLLLLLNLLFSDLGQNGVVNMVDILGY